jgi:hypothetical protein
MIEYVLIYLAIVIPALLVGLIARSMEDDKS